MSLFLYSLALAGAASLLTYLLTARHLYDQIDGSWDRGWARGFQSGAEAAKPTRDPLGRFKPKPTLNPTPCADKPRPKGIAYHVSTLD
jgi:hypothetical protein